MKKWKVHVVAHTHWDREWFFTQSRANTLFANNIKDIVKVLQTDPNFKSFVLDGQMSVLNDYFKEFQTLKSDIKTLAQEKRLLLGPWYSQPDMFSSLGETIIRNLEVGITLANNLGNCLDLAYLPDSFGFNANLPQIFNYFNLHQMIFWRGMKKEDNDKTLYFNWKGIDNSTIPAYCYNSGYWMFSSLFQYSKVNQDNLKAETKEILAKALPILQAIKERSLDTNQQILFPFGQDESPIVKLLPQLIMILNQIDLEHEWVLSDFKTFFKSIPSKPKYEINSSLIWPYVARIHRTITTSRYDIKQLFRQNENLIYHQLEPLQIIYRQIDPQYQNQEIVNEALHKLLASQAHDSLGSCNSDATNKDIVNRLSQASEIIQAEIDIILNKIYYRLDLDLKTDLLVFNLAPYDKKSMFVEQLINHQDKNIEINSSDISDFIITNSQKKQTLASLNFYYQHQVQFQINNMPGLSYKIVKINSVQDKLVIPKITNSIAKINSVIINSQSIDYVNSNHKIIKDIFVINPYDDFGDGYDFSPNPQGYQSLKTSVKNDIIKEIKRPNFYYCQFAHRVSYKNKQEQEFIIEISRFDNQPFDLKIKTINQSKSVKWMLAFNLDIKLNQLDDIFASQSLALMNRRNITENDWLAKGYKENPALLSTNDGLLLVPKANDFTLLTCANNEYSVKDNCLTLTLFRAYEYLGKSDLAWRPGRLSGMNMHTPGALLQQELTFAMQFSFGIKNYTTLLNNWFFKPLTYYHNDPNRIDSFDDRFIVNYDQEKTLSNFKLITISINSELYISNFRISPLGNYELRISNITKKDQEFNLMISGIKSKFQLSRQFLKTDTNEIDSVILKPQKFITINFKI